MNLKSLLIGLASTSMLIAAETKKDAEIKKHNLEAYGFVRLITAYDVNQGLDSANNKPFRAANISATGHQYNKTMTGVNQQKPRNGVFSMHANTSRFGLKGTHDLGGRDNVETCVEGDFNKDQTSNEFRLRHAFFKYCGLTAGHTTSNFTDAMPLQIVDVDGLNETFRQKMIAYTFKFNDGMSLTAALEYDNKTDHHGVIDEAYNTYNDWGNVSNVTKTPDFTAKLESKFSGHRANLRVMARKVELQDRSASATPLKVVSKTSYGVGASFHANLGGNALSVQANWGRGMGKYTNMMGNHAFLAYVDGADHKLDMNDTWNVLLSYQHNVNENLKLGLGLQHLHTKLSKKYTAGLTAGHVTYTRGRLQSAQLSQSLAKTMNQAFVNVVWSPASNVNVGLEYTYQNSAAPKYAFLTSQLKNHIQRVTVGLTATF